MQVRKRGRRPLFPVVDVRLRPIYPGGLKEALHHLDGQGLTYTRMAEELSRMSGIRISRSVLAEWVQGEREAEVTT